MNVDGKLMQKFMKAFETRSRCKLTSNELKILLSHFFFLIEEENNADKFNYAVLLSIENCSDDVALLLVIVGMCTSIRDFTTSEKILKMIPVQGMEPELLSEYFQQKANMCFEKGDFNDALSMYLQIPNRYSHPTVKCRIADCYREMHLYKEALTFYLAYYKTGFEEKKKLYQYDFFQDMNICWSNLGKYDDAIAFFERIVYKKDPYNSIAWFSLANSYLGAKNFAQAETALKYSLAIKPNNVAAHFNLANIYSQTDRLEEAVEHYDEVLKLEGEDIVTLLYKGECLFLLKKYQSAMDCFNKSLSLDRNSAEAHYWIAQIYYSCFEYERALKYVDKAIKLDYQVSDYYNLRGALHAMGNDMEKAEKDYLTSVSLPPRNIDNLVDMARFMVALNKYDVPIPYLKSYIKKYFTDARPSFYLSVCLFYDKKVKQAVSKMIEAIEKCIAYPDENMIDKDGKSVPCFLNDIIDIYPEMLKEPLLFKHINEFL